VERYEEVLKAIFFVKLLQIADLLGLADNVLAVCYVCVPRPLGGDGVVFAGPAQCYITFGGMCMLPQSRGGACFCTRGAIQGYDVICLLSRWQKP